MKGLTVPPDRMSNWHQILRVRLEKGLFHEIMVLKPDDPGPQDTERRAEGNLSPAVLF